MFSPKDMYLAHALDDLISPDSPPASEIFPGVEIPPAIVPGLNVPTILGNGALINFAYSGGDADKVFNFFSEQVRQSPDDASLKVDLALLHVIRGQRQEAYRLQAEALEQEQLFRVVGTKGQKVPTRLRVLALVAPGDFMNNAQLEFILDGSDVGLDVLYVVPGKPLPAALPDHDVVFCAVNESDANIPILRRLSRLLPMWPRPVLNAPEKIARLTRDGVAFLFQSTSTICAPRVRRVALADLRRLASGDDLLGGFLPGISFPILIRPVDSHCGKNLDRIDSRTELATYLKVVGNKIDHFFLAAFHDYRSADGLYRKYRVVLIDGSPFLCHMAVSDRWKIHYVNAGMAESADKRADEARAMETFEHDFAQRHAIAFANLRDRIGLDYFGIDCAELPDGRLLLFEAETAMVIHAMDSPALYPYKQGQMAKVFSAFRELVGRASSRPSGLVDL